jgi:hypothetical protein
MNVICKWTGEPGKVVANKGSLDIRRIPAGEKGETITLIACCNEVGNFLPPYCILKGKRKKNEFEDGMPPGSRVTTNETAACMTTERPPAENDIIQLCLPRDTAHYLQPLFRSFFKPLTTFWQQAVNNWVHSNLSRKIIRQFR